MSGAAEATRATVAAIRPNFKRIAYLLFYGAETLASGTVLGHAVAVFFDARQI